MRHEAEVERQVLPRQPLEQRQDVVAVGGGDEVVGILDAGGDRLQLYERADRMGLQPVAELGFRDLGVDVHSPPPRVTPLTTAGTSTWERARRRGRSSGCARRTARRAGPPRAGTASRWARSR